ncbi:MAG: heme-binding protein [Gammaproteobacteria bacterium]
MPTPIKEHRPTLTWRAAVAIVQGAIREAERLGVRVVVSVCDSSGTVAAQVRMPGAPFHCSGIAEDKAYTAAAFGMPTSGWTAALATLSPEVQMGLRTRPRFVTFGGGIPVRDGEDLLGGVGVSGASEEQDEQCAQAGLRALQE